MEHALERDRHPVHEELGGYQGAKLGMWLFLATELLLFGVMFALFGVFHGKYPNEFKFAHQSLDKIMGGTNTLVLIASSLTVALAIDFIQKGKRKASAIMLLLTIGFASTFLVIKYFEYRGKLERGIFPGNVGQLVLDHNTHAYGDIPAFVKGEHHEPIGNARVLEAVEKIAAETAPSARMAKYEALKNDSLLLGLENKDVKNKAFGLFPLDTHVNENVTERQKAIEELLPILAIHSGALSAAEKNIQYAALGEEKASLAKLIEIRLAPLSSEEKAKQLNALDVQRLDRSGADLFFSFYFIMTGVHGLHVIIGMTVLFIVFLGLLGGKYSHWYYTPVENGGLYWHLVDLIWIYLFPLFYLIK